MQKFKISEVKPASGENKPTILKTDDGSTLSGFQAGLKTIKPGTLLEAETEVKKGYINIKDFNILEEPNTPAPGIQPGESNQSSREDLDARCAVTNVMKAYVKLCEVLPETGPPDKLQELWDRSLCWCDARIPAQFGKTEITRFGDKERTFAPSQEDGFKDAGDFWNKATKHFGKSQSELVVILEINKASDVTNFQLAWDLLEKKLSPGS